LFPQSENFKKPRATIYFVHSYGAYLEKKGPVVAFYQNAGYEVMGFDMRGFG
jgi:alpha-beta hydrolase superfamily lysophospholipase